jgi:iron complex outermembrane receptor protein
MLFHKIIWPFLLCLLQPAFLPAQDGIIKGRVNNGSEDLPAAKVLLGDIIMFTDNSGAYSFSVKAGNYKLIVTHAGYQQIEKEVKIEADKIQIVDFFLLPDEHLGKVVVVGSRSATQRSNLNTPVPVDVFTANRLVKTCQISLTQMLNVIAPSFNTSREILHEPATLRGLDPQHVLILLNGYAITTWPCTLAAA